MSSSGQLSSPYVTSYKWQQLLSFGVKFALETVTGRRLSHLMVCRPGPPQVEILGIDNLPGDGLFIFALNHFKGGLSLGVLSALLASASTKRPDLHDKYLLVVGQRVHPDRPTAGNLTRVFRWVVRWLWQRWAKSVFHVPLGNPQPSIKSLRDWRKRAQQQPMIVFPEGETNLQFKPVRQGAGRWLSSFGTPTVPVGVWWYEDRWHVRFGKPLHWSSRSELHDLQLGLSIAMLLPEDIACDWQEDLQRWKLAHPCA